MSRHKVKIILDPATRSRVWIDGNEMRDVASISVKGDPKKWPSVTLELRPDEVEIHADAKVTRKKAAKKAKRKPVRGRGQPDDVESK